MAISADIKLDIYNGALNRLSSRALGSLTENRESRRVLDQYWGSDNKLVAYALERGDWNFALRARMLEADTAVETEFGFTYAFEKPTDFRRLNSLSSDERFNDALVDKEYQDEAGYWLTDTTPLYVRYVSDDTEYGFNSGVWTEGFIDYIECRLAFLACYRLTNDSGLKSQQEYDMRQALKNAKAVDAMEEGTKFLPSGSWSRSRSHGGIRREKVSSLP